MIKAGKMWVRKAQEAYPRQFLILEIEKMSDYNEPYGEVLVFEDEAVWKEYRLKNRTPNSLSLYGLDLQHWIEDQGGVYFGTIPMEEI